MRIVVFLSVVLSLLASLPARADVRITRDHGGYVGAETIANLKNFVFKGPHVDKGMPDFTGKLSEDDVVKITAFIQGTADAVRPKK